MSAFHPWETLGVYAPAASACYAAVSARRSIQSLARHMTNSGPIPQDCDPYADRRVNARVSVALPAFLQAHGERHSVHLLDLSSGGAKLKCPAGFPVGTKVLLDCGTLGCAAMVRWQNGGLMGLCFEAELDVREVDALQERSRALTALMKKRA